jgi:two-component system response regulator FlrC
MHPRLQAKLLRAIQEREIDRVGSTAPIKINIRLIATSNRDLEDSVKRGDFREDLYFRLNVFNLRMPALRERPSDVIPLAEHFIRKYAEANGVPVKPLSPQAAERLKGHHWKGNVRELENTMHRAVLLAGGTAIESDNILLTGAKAEPQVVPPAAAAQAGRAASGERGATLVGRTVADVERDLIIDTLSHCLGNRTHAANILGISIRTLRNKLKQYSQEGMSVPLPGEGERVPTG